MPAERPFAQAVAGSRLARPGIATGAYRTARGDTRPTPPGRCATRGRARPGCVEAAPSALHGWTGIPGGSVQCLAERSPVDLQPLVDHIARLEREIGRLTEAATVWQVRARQAEERLPQIEAGRISQQESPPDTPSASGRAGNVVSGGVTSPEETPAQGFWELLWRAVMGKP